MKIYEQAKTETIRKMFVHNLSYIGILKNIEILGEEILTYIKEEFPTLYDELLKYLIRSEYTQFSSLKGMLTLQEMTFIIDIIKVFIDEPYMKTNVFEALYKAQKSMKNIVFDTRCLDIALRYKKANAISAGELRNIMCLGMAGDEKKIEARLFQKTKQLRKTLYKQNQNEIAGEIIYDKIDEIVDLLQKVYRKEV